jgi:hypothetical protein
VKRVWLDNPENLNNNILPSDTVAHEDALCHEMHKLKAKWGTDYVDYYDMGGKKRIPYLLLCVMSLKSARCYKFK